jgi:hypothetical protein
VPVPVYTDLFNEGYDDLVAKLQTVPNLQVVNDPRNIVPPCVFVNIDSIEGYNYNIAKLIFTLQIRDTWPRQPRRPEVNPEHARQVYSLNIGVISGRPNEH